MNDITNSLQTIREAVAALPQHGPLTPSQQTFVRHIDSTALQLLEFVQPVPGSEAALQQILPHLGDKFTRPQPALFGYARMLLDHPESFDGALPTADQCSLLEEIYKQGLQVSQRTEALTQAAQTERQSLRSAAASALDLQAMLSQQASVWHYWLREASISFSVDIPNEPLWVMMNAYHLREFIRHVLVTMAYELIEYGRLRIWALSDQPGLAISCSGIRLDVPQMNQLFERQGRQVYRQQMSRFGARIETQREAGYGAILRLLMVSVS